MSAETPADTVIEKAARVALDAMEAKQRADKEAVRAALGDLAVDLDGKEHDYRVEAWEVARALRDAGLLADPADRDYWRELVRHAEASESWERNQKERAEAEVAELRQKLSDCELLLTDLGKTHTRVSGERDELRATVDRVRKCLDPYDADDDYCDDWTRGLHYLSRDVRHTLDGAGEQ